MSFSNIRNKSLLLSLIVIAGFLFTVALTSADTDAKEVYPEQDHIVFLIDTAGTTAGVYQYTGTDQAVSIPKSVSYEGKSYSVERICVGAFANKDVTSVTMPEGLKTIGESAFSNCKKLTSINIPSSVIELEWCCFESCDSLETVTFGSDPKLVTIGGSSFYCCNKLKSIAIPDGVTDIGTFAFKECRSLTSMSIPDMVTVIQDSAFRDCSNLTTVTFGASPKIKEIGSYAFHGCSQLATFNLPATVTDLGCSALSNTAITSIDLSKVTNLDDEVLLGCASLKTVILNSGLTSIGYGLFQGCGKLPSIEIPSGVKTIGGAAFEDCASLTSITIPNGVKTIGGSAFEGCTGLTSIVIPDSVISIGESCFEDCKNVATLTIGSGISKIPFTAFDGLTSLTNVIIPSNVKEIDYSFNGCVNLSSLTIQEGVKTISGFNSCAFTVLTLPDSVTELEYFNYCENLTTVNIGKGLKSFGEYRPFEDCPALERFTVASGNTVFRTADGVLYSDGGSKLCIYPQGKTDVSFIVPDQVSNVSVKTIGEFAFRDNAYLESVKISEGVTTIGHMAFNGCYPKSLSFPDTLATVEDEIAYNLEFYYNDTKNKIDQTADNLKGKMWCGNGRDGNIAKLFYFDSVHFTVTFISEGLIVKEMQTNNYGKISEDLPTPPDNPGYTFEGWWTSIPGGVLVTPDYVFTKDTSVYAEWEYAPGVVTGVSLDKTSNSIDVGGKFTLVATVTPSDAPNKDVTWKSSDTSVATVDSNGVVYGVSEGDAVITVTTVDGGKEATCNVYVGTSPQPSGGGVDIGLIVAIIVIILIVAGAAYYFFIYGKKRNE